MLNCNQLHQQLETVSNRHSKLTAKFQSFAKYVEEQVTHEAFRIKGITVSLHIEDGYFTVAFAGRALRFTFSSVPFENGLLVGNVTCVLMKDFPEKLFVHVGEFTFAGNGKTNLVAPDDVDSIIIDDDISALYIALNFIHESLVKDGLHNTRSDVH